MIIKDLGLIDYQTVCDDMRLFTTQRDDKTEDELWLLEHPSVFSQGLNGKEEHILDLKNIPIIKSDRGGQVTYHGQGQLIAYTLFDLKRRKTGVREMVSCLENSVISMLNTLGLKNAQSRQDAPGVYVGEQKIASLGLRVKRGKCYHGVSINIDMDLTPFSYINPCGFPNLEMVDLKSLGITISMEQSKIDFTLALKEQMRRTE